MRYYIELNEDDTNVLNILQKMKIPWLESNYVFYKEKIDNNILFNSVIFQGYDDVGKFELALDIALYYVKRSSVEESIDKIFIIKKEDGAKI
ncbi:MAG: hypothetical protein CM15mP93_08930 [Thiotrichaceae bacterium]|nr:MAG: hypothetical protein CM15mP93_08930 [Thiotrichaceae bacterium]